MNHEEKLLRLVGEISELDEDAMKEARILLQRFREASADLRKFQSEWRELRER